MENSMDEKKGLDFYIKFCQEKDKEIERLEKEKEWLFNRSIRNDSHTWAIHIETARERLLKEMQQALKEE